jgi:hypothetical protein
MLANLKNEMNKKKSRQYSALNFILFNFLFKSVNADLAPEKKVVVVVVYKVIT